MQLRKVLQPEEDGFLSWYARRAFSRLAFREDDLAVGKTSCNGRVFQPCIHVRQGPKRPPIHEGSLGRGHQNYNRPQPSVICFYFRSGPLSASTFENSPFRSTATAVFRPFSRSGPGSPCVQVAAGRRTTNLG